MTTNQVLLALQLGQCVTVTPLDDHHSSFVASVSEIKRQDHDGSVIIADLLEPHGSFGDKVVLCTDVKAHGSEDHIRCVNHSGYTDALDKGKPWYGVRASVATA